MTQLTKPFASENKLSSRIQIEVRDIPQMVRKTVSSQYGGDADGGDIRHYSGDADGGDIRH